MNNTTEKRSGIFLKILEAIIYLFVVNSSYLFILHFDFQEKYTINNLTAYNEIWVYITIVTLLVLIFNRMFDTFKYSKTENIIIVLISTIMIAFCATMLAFIFRSFALPRSVIFLGFILQTLLFLAIKLTIKVQYEKHKKEKKVALFCSLNLLEEAVEKLYGSPHNQKEKIIFVSELTNFDKSNLNEIDKVYIYDIYNSELLEKYVNYCILKGIPVCIVPKSYELAMTNSHFYMLSDVPLIKINQVGLSIEYRIIKRTMDIFLSTIGILVFSPFMILTAIAIYINDGGPAFYKQERVTIDNKSFYVYKFRTMIKEAEKYTGPVWAGENDPRITKLGRVLRKYWLDELPQLFNVLKGDMSFVGPRPERPELIKEFVKDYPDFKLRTLVKCGLTGYAQVMAKYETTPNYKLKFDLFYIINANFLFDINIIIMTLRKVFLRLIHKEEKFKKYDEIIKIWNVDEIYTNDNSMYFIYK